ncbi:MAG TPA: alkaline phosphatase family protein, partial [Candidatus Dormibacteraeota bacterium]|nr:alkaline phosphatase family protein [Candidatus Dormibacteraeota bacterium]
RRASVLAAAAALVAGGSAATAFTSANATTTAVPAKVTSSHKTATPIKHLVVIFQENVSFDHYFGTYPNAANAGDGQPFTAAAGTPAVDGLLPATDASIPAALQHSADLTTTNPNSALPKRLDATAGGIAGGPGGQITCDQDHNYSDEQQAFDGGGMDRFVQSLGTDGGSKTPGTSTPCDPKIVMDYYDGNTVPAMWNYAQQFAMSDNSYGTTFGPSSPGGLNVTSGNSGGVDMTHTVNAPSVATPTKPNADITADGTGGFSLTSDAQPYWDDCSTRDAVAMSGQNVGDELNAAGVSWGWFEGGMKPTTSYADALAATGNTGQSTATFKPDEFKGAGFQNGVPHSTNQGLCDAVHPVGAAFGATIGTAPWGYKDDYIPHHEPFMYYASTANPHHLSLATDASGSDTLGALGTIGTDTQSYVDGAPQFDTPNHNYDTSDFDQLMAAITRGDLSPDALPAVSYLKAPGYQDGHGAYSDPADEQRFVTREINALMASPDWPSTAVIINYDDSDGWYDHANPGVLNPSLSPADNLTATNATLPTSQQCGPMPQTSAPLAGQQGRCGFGPRLPMMVISPFAKHNAVDHDLSDQASVVNFIEYNWGLPGISGSADQLLASLDGTEGAAFDLAGLFDFRGRTPRMFLDPSTGQPVSRDSLP